MPIRSTLAVAKRSSIVLRGVLRLPIRSTLAAAALVALTLPAGLGLAAGEASSPPRTRTAAPGAPRPAATLADLAWLVGTWQGKGLGGFTEDIWAEPRAGAMPGLFRVVKDGQVLFYEILTFVESEGSLELRLKHFHPDLKGWEERDQVRSFPLVAKSERELFFDHITFTRLGDDEFECVVAIRSADGTEREEPFHYRRVR
jgi:hypothetical protein